MITEDLDAYLSLFGRACTWTPQGGADVPVTLIVHDGRTTFQDGEYQVRTRDVSAEGKASDLGSIEKGDIVATTLETYVVEDSYPDDANPAWMHLVLGFGG